MLLIIPMAGRGSRYANVGYTTPKPLIEINGKPMLYHAFQSVKDVPYDKVIFIALTEHEQLYGVSKLIKEQIVAEFELILLDDVTEGQLCTVLEAREFFKEGERLVIAASDTYIKSNFGQEIENSKDCAGLISVAKLAGDHWSFAKTDDNDNVIEVAEKVRISDNASTGLYYFSNSKIFQKEAEELIAQKETAKGEYYIMPLYSKYIQKNKRITISKAEEIWDMGTPESKQAFEDFLKNCL